MMGLFFVHILLEIKEKENINYFGPIFLASLKKLQNHISHLLFSPQKWFWYQIVLENNQKFEKNLFSGITSVFDPLSGINEYFMHILLNEETFSL